MKPLALADLVDLAVYESVRDEYRRRVIEHKHDRRIALGDRVTLLFEDRETIRYQVLEMARVERIAEPGKLQHELDVYNALLPGENELSATLFIEIPDLGSIRAELDRLLGLDECVWLVLGGKEGEREEAVRAVFDPGQLEEERISAVHYLRFALSPAQAERLADASRPARLRVDHPHYRHETELAPATRASLARDLRGETPALLDPRAAAARAGAPPPADRLLFETAALRALRPGRPAAAEHVVIEPVADVAGLLDAEPELLAELLGAAQRVAREIVARGGRARVAIDVQPGTAPARLRVHVVSVDS